MKIDVQGLQSLLDLYRSATDGKIPVHPTLQPHFIENRKRLLEGFDKLASGQGMLMGCMVPENDAEAAQLAEARRIVDDFSVWAKGPK